VKDSLVRVDSNLRREAVTRKKAKSKGYKEKMQKSFQMDIEIPPETAT